MVGCNASIMNWSFGEITIRTNGTSGPTSTILAYAAVNSTLVSNTSFGWINLGIELKGIILQIIFYRETTQIDTTIL